jgi:hypothetical protein
MGLRHGLPELRGTKTLATPPPDAEYPHQEALGPGLALTSIAGRRAAPLTKLVR